MCWSFYRSASPRGFARGGESAEHPARPLRRPQCARTSAATATPTSRRRTSTAFAGGDAVRPGLRRVPAVRAVAGGDHDRPVAGRHPDDAVLGPACRPSTRSSPSCSGPSGYFAGVAGRTYHLDGVGRVPEEIEAGLRQVRPAHLPEAARLREDRRQGPGDPRPVPRVPRPGARRASRSCSSSASATRTGRSTATPSRGPHDPTKLKLPPHYPDTKLVREDFARYYDEIARFDARRRRTSSPSWRSAGWPTTRSSLFMGDNGASQFRGKGTLYEFGVHVPLIVRWPGVGQAGLGDRGADLGRGPRPDVPRSRRASRSRRR